MCSILTGISVEDFEKEEVKSNYLGKEWNRYIQYKDKRIISSIQPYPHIPMESMTIRQLLQEVGTDAMRDVIHPDVWVNALMKDYINKPSLAVGIPNYQSNWIITDCRFPNEAKAIKNRDGIILRVNRNSLTGFRYFHHLNSLNKSHISETSLDTYEFDYIIDNSGTIEELIEKVKEMLIFLKII